MMREFVPTCKTRNLLENSLFFKYGQIPGTFEYLRYSEAQTTNEQRGHSPFLEVYKFRAKSINSFLTSRQQVELPKFKSIGCVNT